MTRSKIQPAAINITSLNYEIILAGGGLITTYTSGGNTYRVHSFLSDGTFEIVEAKTADVLLVAGGGAGARYSANGCGGGGAGGMVVGTSIPLLTGTYAITIGAGGAGSTSQSYGAQGSDSTIVHSSGTITAKGGGGGFYSSIQPQNAGGSSGGGGNNTTEVAASTQTNQTFNSTTLTGYGNAQPAPPSGGYGAGGAGAGGVGGTAAVTPNLGGAGLANNFRTGSNITYAAGGDSANNGASGAANTGTGGDASYSSSGSGGSGICVIRYTI